MHRIPPLQLFHASVPGGPSGVTFQIGQTRFFTSPDDERLYIIDDPATLLVNGPLPPSVASFVLESILEPRFAALTGK